MYFKNHFFEDEVRDGFYVSSLMKKCWASQLEVLSDVASVCDKYGIKWYADFGTLLGALRHKGYIPWDDDLDISMLRDDYNRFLEIADKELKVIWKDYNILNLYNGRRFEMLTRIQSSHSISFEKDYINKFHGYPMITGIDIFPLDYICSDQEDEEFRREMAKTLYSIADNDEIESIDDEALAAIEQMTGRTISRLDSIKYQLYKIVDALFSLYESEQAIEVAYMPDWCLYKKFIYPIEAFESTIKLPFENIMINAPQGYDIILKGKYGEYMTPVKSGGGHDYPYYEEMVLRVNEIMGNNSPFFRCIPDIENIFERKTMIACSDDIVFLPFKASAWCNMEWYWKHAVERNDVNIKVIPIPYYIKDTYGTIVEECYEKDMFPDYVKVEDYRDYDFEVSKPCEIVIQNPYDGDNYVTTVPPYFFAENLRNYTAKLTYIPYFVTDDIEDGEERAYKMMDYYVVSPGVIYSHCVITPNDNIKYNYLRKLTETFGEDTEKHWKSVIKTKNECIEI